MARPRVYPAVIQIRPYNLYKYSLKFLMKYPKGTNTYTNSTAMVGALKKHVRTIVR
jgi:hypothetical protein